VLLYEDNYNFLSKMCLDRMRRACCEMIASARRSGAGRMKYRDPFVSPCSHRR